MRKQIITVRRHQKDCLVKVAPKKTKAKNHHVCLECNEDFLSSRITAKYCSEACKMKAYRQRRGY